MKYGMLALTSIFACILSVAQPNKDPFQGNYINRQNALGIQLKKEQMGYSGKFVHAIGSFPLTALRIGALLMGEYAFNGNKVAFGLTKKNNTMMLTSEGVELPMEAVSQKTFDSIIKASNQTVSANKAPIQQTITTSEMSTFWKNRLAGKQLLFLKTDNYGSVKILIGLNNNGQFQYTKTMDMLSSGGVGTGTYADKNTMRGNWQIRDLQGQPTLILSPENAQDIIYPIRKGSTDGQVLLNNSRFFIQTN